jgi:hypothetical protein
LTFVGRIKLSHCFLLLKWINQRQCHLCFSLPLSLIHINICVCVCVSFFISQTRFHLLSFLPHQQDFLLYFSTLSSFACFVAGFYNFWLCASKDSNVSNNPTRGHSYFTCFPVRSLFGLPFIFLFFCQWEF